MRNNGKLAYQARKMKVEFDPELRERHDFINALYARDGKICVRCHKSTRQIYMKDDDFMIPTIVGADMFHRNAFRTGKLNLDKTFLLCRPCFNSEAHEVSE